MFIIKPILDEIPNRLEHTSSKKIMKYCIHYDEITSECFVKKLNIFTKTNRKCSMVRFNNNTYCLCYFKLWIYYWFLFRPTFL